MFQSTASNILPIYKSELTEQSKSSNYNWKTLTKAGLVFVTTTGAFLALKTTGSFSFISSWLKNNGTNFDEQETNLAVPEGDERTDLSLTGFELPEALQTNNLLQPQHTAFTPQRDKRDLLGIPKKIGPEFQVNTYTTSNQQYPSVAGLSDGKFVVVWESNGQDGDSYGIYGQMYNADGTEYLSEFQVNTYITRVQKFPSVAGLSDGKFVVVWESGSTSPPYQDGNGYGVYGQIFNADGTKYLSEFQVNTYTRDSQYNPSVADLSDGKFVVTWASYGGQDGDLTGVYGQMYNANGTKFLSEFQVNTYTIGSQYQPSIAGLSDGRFVVTWVGAGDEAPRGIHGQMFSADGNKFLSGFQVNTYTMYDFDIPSITGLNNSKFVVTWISNWQDGDWYGIYGQMYNANGTKFLSEFQVNTYTTNYQWYPSVAELSDSKFVVTWQSGHQDGSGDGIYGQMYNINGSKYGSEFLVNTNTVNDQRKPSVAGLKVMANSW